jgi:hypothetical protein
VIQRRIHEAVEFLELQSKKLGDSDIVPSTQQLIGFTEDVHDYAEKILPLEQSGRRKRRNTGLVLTSRPRVDSAQTTNSLATSSFTSRCDSSHVKIAESATPPTNPNGDVQSILNYCDKCSGTCTQTNLHRIATPPSPTPSTPNPRPSGVEEESGGT